jgi:hypothetical protein
MPVMQEGVIRAAVHLIKLTMQREIAPNTTPKINRLLFRRLSDRAQKILVFDSGPHSLLDKALCRRAPGWR